MTNRKKIMNLFAFLVNIRSVKYAFWIHIKINVNKTKKKFFNIIKKNNF